MNDQLMTDTEAIALITQILGTFDQNLNADDGNRHLSDPSLCIQAIESVAYDQVGARTRLQHDGWIQATNETSGQADARS
jgi:hypothetical protein